MNYSCVSSGQDKISRHQVIIVCACGCAFLWGKSKSYKSNQRTVVRREENVEATVVESRKIEAKRQWDLRQSIRKIYVTNGMNERSLFLRYWWSSDGIRISMPCRSTRHNKHIKLTYTKHFPSVKSFHSVRQYAWGGGDDNEEATYPSTLRNKNTKQWNEWAQKVITNRHTHDDYCCCCCFRCCFLLQVSWRLSDRPTTRNHKLKEQLVENKKINKWKM